MRYPGRRQAHFEPNRDNQPLLIMMVGIAILGSYVYLLKWIVEKVLGKLLWSAGGLLGEVRGAALSLLWPKWCLKGENAILKGMILEEDTGLSSCELYPVRIKNEGGGGSCRAAEVKMVLDEIQIQGMQTLQTADW